MVGLPFSGTSTLFTALTRTGSHGGHANVAVVPVPDPRVEALAELTASGRAVHAQVRFVDVPGGVSSAQGIARLRETDALAIVVRCFGTDPDPAGDLAEVRDDLLLADQAVIEPAVAKADRRAHGRPTPETEALHRAEEALAAATLLRDAGLSEDEAMELRPIGPLTLKPWVVVANLEEGTDVPAELPGGTVPVYASIEAETAEMDPDEARELLDEFGVHEPGLEMVIRACYGALDLITFLTSNEEEAHAWEVRRGAKAPEAAGAVHSDFERGFIRAEVIGFDDLVEAGSIDAARHRGLLRVEGKDYEVREGDVLRIRFAV